VRPVTRRVFSAAAVQGLCNLAGIAVGVGYIFVLFDGNLSDPDVQEVLRWAGANMVVVYLFIAVLLMWLGRPISQWTADAPLPVKQAAARRALELPARFFVTSLLVWTASGLSIFPWVAARGLESFPALRVALSTLLVGALSSTVVFYGVEWYARRSLLPVVLEGVDVASLGRVFHLSLRAKVVLLSVTSTVLPVAALAFTAQDAQSGATALIYVTVVALGLGLLQAGFITTSVLKPLKDLAVKQRAVAADDLSPRVPVQSADDVGTLALGFNQMVQGLQRGVEIRATFGRYVSPRVLERILEGRVAADGEVLVATVLFCDLRGFTAMSDGRAAPEVVAILNRYLDVLVESVSRHDGVVDKFIGDAVMAAFGAPLSQGDDAFRAVQAALDMVAAVDRLNATQRQSGGPALDLGVGLHTGEVVAGNIGSTRQLQYTLVGDTVNTASRIEQLTKTLGARVLVSQQTLDAVGDRVVARALPPVEVKGKREPLTVYEVTGLSGG